MSARRYLSVCSGIEAASVAWGPLGWEPVAFAEVEPFPCAVLAHHYPGVPNLGDITRFQEWPDAAFDVLVGGTPCQSFSVAGLRAGLADPRGNLALTFLAIADRYRPRWVVWENVPGVLSADSHVSPDPRPPAIDLDGNDGPADGTEVVVEDEYDADEVHAFACLLAGFSELGYHGAYGTLDAQYFRLAQRRRRVFAVFHLGDWHRAAAVLLERSCLSGHPAPRRETGQDATAGTLRSTDGGIDCDHGAANHVVPALTACGGTERKHGHGWGQQELANGYAMNISEECAYALRGGRTQTVAAVDAAMAFADVADPVAANQARTYTREGSNNFRLSNVAHTAMQVRRLTPRECERLQGFPDDYTLITYRGKPAADGPRYKALGNSMAVPVMRWIGERIELVEDIGGIR